MDSQWLKTQFTLNPDKSKAGLAQSLGLEASAISKILKGARQIKAQEYAAMRRYFGLPLDGEPSAHHDPGAYVLRPLDGLGESPATKSDWVIPANIISARTKAPSDKIRIFEVAESAMEPDFRRGEHVLVDISDRKPSPPGIFVVSDGFGNLLRQCEYIPGTATHDIRLSARDRSFQPQILTDNEFTIIGRVIAKLQML